MAQERDMKRTRKKHSAGYSSILWVGLQMLSQLMERPPLIAVGFRELGT
jgi:hypothetical protein